MKLFYKVAALIISASMLIVGPMSVSAAIMTGDVTPYALTGNRRIKIGNYSNLGIAKTDIEIRNEKGEAVAILPRDAACEIIDTIHDKAEYEILSGNVKGYVNTSDLLVENIAETRAIKLLENEAKKENKEFTFDLETYDLNDDQKSYIIEIEDRLNVAKEIPKNIITEKKVEETNKPEIKKNKYTDAELKLLASIIYCEAGDHSYDGMLAVGNVIMNRVKSNSFPNTIKQVVYARRQFSPARNGRLASALSRGVSANCYKAAKEALSGKNIVPGYYYFDGSIHKGGYKKISKHYFWKTPW